MEKWIYSHANDSEGILDAALGTFGLDRRYLFKVLGIPFDPAKSWNGNKIGAGEWFVLCQSLGISADSITWGYSKQEHQARLRHMLETGLLTALPKTPKVRSLIRLAKKERRKESLFKWKHYGVRYCLKLEVRRLRKQSFRFFTKPFSYILNRWPLSLPNQIPAEYENPS